MEIVPELTGQGSFPLYFSKLPDSRISDSLLKTVIVLGLAGVTRLRGLSLAVLFAPEVLAVAFSLAAPLDSAASFFLSSRVASSLSLRFRTALEPQHFWSYL